MLNRELRVLLFVPDEMYSTLVTQPHRTTTLKRIIAGYCIFGRYQYHVTELDSTR
jgi:hypothetical protein